MTIRHMKIFVAVCEQESVTKAAEKLYISQPSVSQAIAELESHFGVPLFDRISRRLYITEAGKQLYEYMSHILSLHAEMDDRMKNWNQLGPLRIGSSITIGNCVLPVLVAEFGKLYPDVQIFVTVDNSDNIEQKVLSGELDFALIEGTVHSNQIISEQFMNDRLVLVCAKNHPLSKHPCISVADIGNYPFLSREKGSGTRAIVDSSLLLHNAAALPVWESISTQALINAVRQGLGISILPYRLVEPEVRQGSILCAEIKELPLERPFHLIYSKNKYLSGIVRQFMEFITAKSSLLAD